MADMMNFPKRWEDFLHDYEFEDVRKIYTNGSRLIPSFRVKQMMEHYAPVRHAKWVDNHCTACGMMPMGDEMWKRYDGDPPLFDRFMDYCPTCGAKMDGGAD